MDSKGGGTMIDLDAEEEEINRRILASLTPEEIERLERLDRGEAIHGIPLDLDAEEEEINRRILASLTPEEIERLERLDRGEAVGTIDLTGFLR